MAENQLVENTEFKFKLNGVRDLQTQLERFKKTCDAFEIQQRRRCKRRYYHIGVMAKIVQTTTDDELGRLLNNGTRTFLVDAVMNKPDELDDIFKRTKNAIEEFANLQPIVQTITGLALEITGDCCRLGRLRNNCSVLLARGEILNLTVDESYKYSGFKEIAYVINLKYYLRSLQLDDILVIGKEVRGKVAKRLKSSIAVLIEEPGILNSYEYIELPNQCSSIQQEVLPELFKNDLAIADQYAVNYIVVPQIRCKNFLKVLRLQLSERSNMKLIGILDYAFIITRMLDLMGIVKLLDYVWITNAFNGDSNITNYIFQDVIPIAKCLKKPIIGSVPLERCSDFKRFENHNFLWKIDSMYIEKSQWCNKYPLIVRKLLPIRDFRLGIVENCLVLKNVLDSFHTIVNFIIRTISSIECQAIFMHSDCETATTALGRVEIYCPVFVIFPLRGEEFEKENMRHTEMARTLNLRRNLRSVVYDLDKNECNLKPIDFGIEYARQVGLLETGDFIITLEMCKEDEENVEYGAGEDVVILRAFYLPPSKTCEKFKYV